MTDPLPPALASVREALLARARADADEVRAAAARRAAARTAAARDQAEQTLGAARRRGEEDAEALLGRERLAARGAARGVLLRARAAAYEDLRTEAVAAVARLLADPGARDRLATRLRDALGPGTVVQDAPDGGLVGLSPDGRSIDASGGALVAACIAEMDLEDMWTPG